MLFFTGLYYSALFSLVHYSYPWDKNSFFGMVLQSKAMSCSLERSSFTFLSKRNFRKNINLFNNIEKCFSNFSESFFDQNIMSYLSEKEMLLSLERKCYISINCFQISTLIFFQKEKPCLLHSFFWHDNIL